MKLFTYIGSKDRIYPLLGGIRKDIKESELYIEPFGGSFSLGLKLLKEEVVTKAVYNEINKDVYNIFYQCKTNNDTMQFLYPIIQHVLVTYNEDNETIIKVSTDDIVQKLGFNDETHIKCTQAIMQIFYLRSNRGKYNTKIIDRRKIIQDGILYALDETSKLLANVELQNEDYKTILHSYNKEGVFWFIDPPYDYKWSENKTYYGISTFNQQELESQVSKLRGKGLLTNFPTTDMINLYKNYTKDIKLIHSPYKPYEELWVSINR